ncbi:hypothetical protein [Antrihabitans cavernicola]|uniref:Secreted protein n=1 Tax=Antrihabitans cavernicola TaxID=2495913 RepID=A0A5A7S7D7_9NOCA|nr:hypothetical protein [Spelaeibacter cavernicola]KAA0021414.1 hypothetical protein FOY51_19435 [Spelaeibacter cavernicola]
MNIRKVPGRGRIIAHSFAVAVIVTAAASAATTTAVASVPADTVVCVIHSPTGGSTQVDLSPRDCAAAVMSAAIDQQREDARLDRRHDRRWDKFDDHHAQLPKPLDQNMIES